MLSCAQLTRIDAFANLSCGLLTLAAPSLWRLMGLPSERRIPAGTAMVVGGALMARSCVQPRPSAPSSPAIALEVVANLTWSGLGGAATRLTTSPSARLVLAGIAGYDAVMGAAKLMKALHQRARLG